MIMWKWVSVEKMWRMSLLSASAAVDLDETAQVVPVSSGGCALLSRTGVRINGIPCLPIQVLADRDEIFARKNTYYFSAESPAEAVTFKACGRKMRCARCLGWLVDGDAILQCPRCNAHHHAEHWTYAPGCQKCGYPTAGLLWVPEPLE